MFRSFTFRLGAAIFLLFLGILGGLRYFSYHQTLAMEMDNVRRIILAHQEGIVHGIDRNGVRYAKYLVEAVTNEPEDRHLILAVKSRTAMAGNLREWPEELTGKDGWMKRSIFMQSLAKPVHALLLLRKLKGGNTLLVGYNLLRIEQTKKALAASVIHDIWLSVAAALLLTFIILYLLSRHLEKVNNAYRQVRAGEIGFRIGEDGSRDQFAKLARNFNEMMEWVSSLISTLKDSTSSIAHDLRTPLARIRLRLQQTAQDDKPGSPHHRALMECIDDVDHMTEIFNSILRIAKAEDLSLVRHFKPVDLRAMLGDLAEYYEDYLEGENQTIALDMPPEPMSVMGERQLLGQAIANLISNASKYAPGPGTIRLSLSRSEDRKGMVEITVADSGPGIPEEFRDRVKERFFRLDASRNTPGMGLGLNLAEAVVKLHKGTLVLADNKPGLRSIMILPEFTGEAKAAA